MSDTTLISKPPAAAPRGLLARFAGVILSPTETYADVAARPRVLGMLVAVLVVVVGCQVLFLSTEVGKDALIDQQIRALEGFGVTVTDEMLDRMEGQLGIAAYTTAAVQTVVTPILLVVVAGILFAVFNALLGGSATFKQMYAVVVHSWVIIALQQLFSTPISYARGDMASTTTLAVFVPMLEETHVVVRLLGAIDLFFVWWTVSLAIGLGVLYTRRTGPIASALLVTYVGIAAIVAVVRSAF